jgi:hypothetical protein
MAPIICQGRKHCGTALGEASFTKRLPALFNLELLGCKDRAMRRLLPYKTQNHAKLAHRRWKNLNLAVLAVAEGPHNALTSGQKRVPRPSG